MDKIVECLSKAMYFVLLTLLCIIVSGFLFTNNNPFGQVNVIVLLLCFCIVIVIGYFWLRRIFHRQYSRHQRRVALIIYFILFFITMIICGIQLQVEPSWDFGSASSVAVDFAEDGYFNNLDYFYMHPNNHFIIFVLSFLFRIGTLVGFTNYTLIGISTNVVSILCTVALIYLYVKKSYNEKIAACALMIAYFIGPFLTYVPIYYSDTLSLPFGMLLLYLSTFLDFSKKEVIKSNMIYIIGMGISAYLGFGLKASILIIMIALVIYWILFYKLKGVKVTLVTLGVFLISYFCFQLTYHFISYDEARLENEKFNSAHYLMVGTSKVENTEGFNYYGFYNDEDFYFTLSLPQVSRNQYTIEKTMNRISERGILGNLDFYYNKLTQTWCDGTYYASEKLDRYPTVEDSFLGEIFRKSGSLFSYYFYYAQVFHFSIIMLLIASVIHIIKNREYKKNFVVHLTLFGLILFLLIWETRSRYIVNLIPLMICGALPIIEQLESILRRNKDEKCS